MLSGASVRYRFYTRWGVTAEELSRIVFSYSVTFWLGLLALGGLSLVVSPLPRRASCRPAVAARRSAWLLMLVPPAYRRWPRSCGGDRLHLPELRAAAAVAAHRRRRSCCCRSLDWALAGAVLVRAAAASAPALSRSSSARSCVAILLGMASHVPGGVGVFEGLMVLLLKPVPRRRGSCCRRWSCIARSTTCCRWRSRSSGSSPTKCASAASAAARIGGGARRLDRAAHAARAGRLHIPRRPGPAVLGRDAGRRRAGWSCSSASLPLGVIEASHFLGSVAGAALLLLSQGLARRLDAAYS